MSVMLLPGGRGKRGDGRRDGETPDKRLFFGLAISAPVKGEIARLIGSFGIASPQIRWVRSDNLHITVKFLGGLAPERISSLVVVGQDVANSLPPFALRAEGLGLFPNHERPRVVYAGIEGEGALRLERELVTALESLGFPPEQRHYAPHITIGRVRSDLARGKLARLARKYHHHFIGPVTVNELILFESALHRAGPVYTPHTTFSLKGGEL